MRSLPTLIVGLLILAAPLATLAAKPTVTVVIPGWTPGDGRQIEPASLRTLGERAGQTLADAGSNNKTIYYKWPSHGNNDQAVADLARQIKAEAAEMGTEVDLQIIGHSRGGIVACEVLEKIGDDPQFNYVQGVLLDPTAAITAGDRFPSKKPAGVDRLINYYDGKNGIQIGGRLGSDYPGWRNTRSDRDIAGAENHELDLSDGDTHVTIVGSYVDGITVGDSQGQAVTHGADADSETFYEQKEGVSSYTTVPEEDRGTNQKIVMQTPKNDQERLTGPLEKGLHDVFDAAGQAASDSAREYHNVLRGDIASSDSPNHWKEMGGKGWVHGRDLAAGGAEQLGHNLENGAQHTKEMLQRGRQRLEQNARDFAKDPGGTLEKGLSHTGREIERLGNHYASGAVNLAEHELNMAASGVEHAGRMIDKQGDKAARSLQADGQSASDYLLDGDRFSSDERTVTRPLADTVREGSKLAGDVVREGGKLGGDVLQAGGHAAKDVTREGGQAANDLSQTAGRAAKDTLVAGGKAAGDSGREVKRTADAAGKRARVFAGDAARESRQAGRNIAREAQSLPGNLQQIAERPDRAIVTGRNNAKRVFANVEDRAGGTMSQARDKALGDAARAEERTGQTLSRARDRVQADIAKNVERGGQVLTRTRDRVQAQPAGFEQNAGQTLTSARDRASENLTDAEQNTGRTLARTRDRVVAATHNAQQQVTQSLSDVGQQVGSSFSDGREQLGNAWNDFREQVPRPLPGGWFNQQPVRQNPLADFGRNLAEAMQREQARQQAQRAQEIARQQAIAAQQAAQRQAEAARRRIEEQARQAAIARDNARRQAEFLRQQAAEQARRREAEIRAAAERAQRDAQRELSNAGKYLEDRGNSFIGGAKKVFGW